MVKVNPPLTPQTYKLETAKPKGKCNSVLLDISEFSPMEFILLDVNRQ